MRITEYLIRKIEVLEIGNVFSYSNVIDRPEDKEAVIKALNRMVIAGKLSKLGKGKYYKAETTVFGNLEPAQYEVVKDLLEENGKITGYLTGYSIYNKLGLTTQVSNILQIGKNEIRPSFKRNRYTISFVKQKNEIRKDNIHLLQLLDAIRYIKKIPDASIRVAFEQLLLLVSNLQSEEKQKIGKLTLKYPASTRALTGLILEMSGDKKLAEKLKKTLNPVTIYTIPYISAFIAESNRWNIR